MIVGARDSTGVIMKYEIDTAEYKVAIQVVREAVKHVTGKEPIVVLARVK